MVMTSGSSPVLVKVKLHGSVATSQILPKSWVGLANVTEGPAEAHSVAPSRDASHQTAFNGIDGDMPRL